jgi:nitrile hydratase beta subunit
MTYTSHADLGGQAGHGPLLLEGEGTVFHEPWEPRVLALTLAMGATGAWNIDISRAARETLPNYLERSYYEVWFTALSKLLAERHLVEPDEVDAGCALHAPLALPRKLMAADVPAALARGSPTVRRATAAPRFAIGQAVRTYAGAVPHHTRLPAYARGKVGAIEHVRGAHVFADAHATGRGESPQWLYTVAFDGSELWPGEAAPGRLRVSIDAWEPYLETL